MKMSLLTTAGIRSSYDDDADFDEDLDDFMEDDLDLDEDDLPLDDEEEGFDDYEEEDEDEDFGAIAFDEDALYEIPDLDDFGDDEGFYSPRHTLKNRRLPLKVAAFCF